MSIAETPDRSDRDYMLQALEEAERAAAEGEVPVGAVLVLEDGSLARGHNRPIALSDPTAHAEILALREAAAKVRNYRLPGSTLYVTVEPCVMCLGAILHARVRRLVYGVEDLKGGGLRFISPLLEGMGGNHRIEVTQGVMADQCRQILQRFFRERR